MKEVHPFKIAAMVLFACALIYSTTTVITGCASRSTSSQRTAFNSLYTVGQTVDAAYKSYLDGVVAGQVATNDVPQVSQNYLLFQNAYALAVAAAAMSSNAPPTADVLNAQSQLLLSIQAAKSKGK